MGSVYGSVGAWRIDLPAACFDLSRVDHPVLVDPHDEPGSRAPADALDQRAPNEDRLRFGSTLDLKAVALTFGDVGLESEPA
jgi:hypothetical protein